MLKKLGLLACAALSLVAAGEDAQAQEVLRDAETEALFRDLSTPIVAASGLDPHNVDVILLNDGSINAFVAGGQAIYVNSGLIGAADHAEEVQGVLAHELGHIVGGHVIRNDEGARPATGITLLSLLLGAAAAAGGAGEAGLGIFLAGQQAALGEYLAFSRAQEATADAASVKFLSKAGISGRGSVNFFKKLQSYEFRYGFKRDAESEFYSTHPMTSDRLATLQDSLQQDPAWNKPEDPDLQRRFLRVKAKLYGYLAEPQNTLTAYPEYMTDIPAHYARAYAYHKQAFMDKALAETDAILAQEPDDPYALELKGQVLLESGRPQEAIPPLRRAVQLTQNQPLIATTFGHALLATEDKANFVEAERVLKAAVAKDHDNPFAWYQLGVVYEAEGDTARARLASAEQEQMQLQFPEAMRNAEAAEAALPKGSPDWLRAQDIAFSSRAMIERTKKRK
ncbi:peptidase M48, Ste24p [Novosphingobium nitrogenifigens DSM 19370]|uniref:Peptidase M48, Ste24p n=1 Tax=Novosphingobium nitrogenifigens DSM 19370 TaxID=983920 RepID=F1Z493_9SPHN|nr:M48 family metalloprotease [Novosphingobium nitrogenifigens]EGD60503.1 peptidase M48, Ste24p [Novosphingobium nitrogenifigens DSM 19370]